VPTAQHHPADLSPRPRQRPNPASQALMCLPGASQTPVPTTPPGSPPSPYRLPSPQSLPQSAVRSVPSSQNENCCSCPCGKVALSPLEGGVRFGAGDETSSKSSGGRKEAGSIRGARRRTGAQQRSVGVSTAGLDLVGAGIGRGSTCGLRQVAGRAARRIPGTYRGGSAAGSGRSRLGGGGDASG
jgi:hypothetical protein